MNRQLAAFDPVRSALDGLGAEAVDLWLRDDDATRATVELDRFVAFCRGGGVAPLFAVIPGSLEESLIAAAAGWPGFWRIGVHGYAHRNRADAGAKKSEFPAHLDVATARAELIAGRALIAKAFGRRALPVFVPPWNRIGTAQAAALSECGFAALSTFARAHVAQPPSKVRVVNTHVDLIDWRGGRFGKPIAVLANELATAVSSFRGPIGILTHHLDHDAACDAALQAIMQFVQDDARLRWRTPEAVFQALAGQVD
jgi:peptidoglycan/xylan/chitin deacetylase (PgdA/CDA1 family)